MENQTQAIEQAQNEDVIVQPKRGRGRPKLPEDQKKEKQKSTKYVQKFREIHGSYYEPQKRAFRKWYYKMKELTGQCPTSIYKRKNKVLQEIENI